MRTVFVNPARRRRRRRRAAPKRRRRRRNAGITPFVSNPLIQSNPRRRRRNPMPSGKKIVKDVFQLALGTAAGAGANRVGISHIPNFYLRNGARVLAAAALAAFGGRYSFMAAAAAGAVMAPIVPEVEMQIAATTKNPQELAAELAGLLEADLSDDVEELEGDDDDDDTLEAELADDDVEW